MILTSFRHNLASLLRFSGRDSRALFWPYAAAVIVFDLVATVALIAEILAPLRRFAADHPGEASFESGPGYTVVNLNREHPELVPDMSLVSLCYAVLVAANVLLLAAAVTRRLHDRRCPGWWGLLPIPFLAAGVAANFAGGVGTDATEGMRPLAPLLLNNALCLFALIILAILLAGAGTKGPNRFGALGA